MARAWIINETTRQWPGRMARRGCPLYENETKKLGGAVKRKIFEISRTKNRHMFLERAAGEWSRRTKNIYISVSMKGRVESLERLVLANRC